MLEKVWAIWITGVLQPSLPHDVLLELNLTERPATVTRSLDLFVQRSELIGRLQISGGRVLDVFDAFDGSMLILGAPGAGKTTLLLQLARDLLQRAVQDAQHPIPVVFPLSSWTRQRRSLSLWLIDALSEQYDVPRKIGQAWVDDDQILPLLDGLDEVADEHQDACVDAINEFRHGHGLLPLAVCSRAAEYEALGSVLRLQGAVMLQPLTTEQVKGYFIQVGEPVAGLREVLEKDPALAELTDTPLMLAVMILAYAGNSLEAIQAHNTTLQNRRESLFAAYLNRMFQRRGGIRRYTREQTEVCLTWLAGQMTRHNQTVFYLEHMQPDWLPKPQRWISTTGARATAALIGGLISGLPVLLYRMVADVDVMEASALRLLWLINVFAGAAVGALPRIWGNITPVETTSWSWPVFFEVLVRPSRRRLLQGFKLGLAIGVVFALCSPAMLGLYQWGPVRLELMGRLFFDLLFSLALGLIVGAPLGLFFGMVAGLGLWSLLLIQGLISANWYSSGALWERTYTTDLVEDLAREWGGFYLLWSAFAAALGGREISTKTSPNQGISRSARLGTISALVSTLLVTLVQSVDVPGFHNVVAPPPSPGTPTTYFYAVARGPRVGLLIGALGLALVAGTFSFLKYGGRACIQHMLLRVTLRHDRLVPPHFVQFLEYAADRIFLRKVGGGYMFMHRLLQDYFTTLHRDLNPRAMDDAP